jgi:hypothetical protein
MFCVETVHAVVCSQDAACKHYLAAVRLCKDGAKVSIALHVRALINAGLVFEAQSSPLRAERCYVDALALDDSNALANTCLSAVRVKQGADLRECLRLVNKAVASEPGLLIAILTKAVVLEAALMFDEAMACFQQAAGVHWH